MKDALTESATSAPATDCGSALEHCPKLRELLSYLKSLEGRANLDELESLLIDLELTGEDLRAWRRFGKKGYKRNVIAKTEWFELLAVCWRSGQCTPIHDHKGSSCAFKVIEGTGCEIRFEPTGCGLVRPTGSVEMQPGYVCAAEDEDIHQVVNAEGEGEDLITLHIYTPALSRIGTYDAPYFGDSGSIDGSPGLYDAT